MNKLKLTLSAAAILLAAGVFTTMQPLPTTAAVQDAVTTYKTKCASCHGVDGSGNTAAGKKLKVRDLRPEAKKLSDAQISELITKGKGKMPANKSFSADLVKQLVAHVRGLK
jgi:mono/diheme cytochrome c family protein